jgi:F0F1-type ATP synthase delta subunit
MFGKMKNYMEQFQMMQKLMKDENFKAFMSHPKVQELFKDPGFQAILKTKDQAKIMGHPKLNAMIRDSEVAQMMSKLDPGVFFQK